MATRKPGRRPPGYATLAGSPREVGPQLTRLGSGHVVALTFEQGGEGLLQSMAAALAGLAPLVTSIVQRRQRAAFESIVEALVPEVPLPAHMLAEARMAAQARKAVLEGAPWLTAAQIADLAGFSASNPSAQPNRWKRDGLIFALQLKGTDYYPGYALDPDGGYRPRKALGPILGAFGPAKDAWGLAYWFASANSFLGGQRPQDLLARQADRVLAAAQDERSGIAHG